MIDHIEVDEEEVSEEVLAEVNSVKRLMDGAEVEAEIQTTFHISIETGHEPKLYLKQFLLTVKPYIHDMFIIRRSMIN